MNIPETINKLTYRIIGVCMQVHSGLGPGFPEDYYQRALEYEFQAQDIPFEPQKPVQVLYKGVQVGLNYLDFVIDESVVLEIKSVRNLDEIHHAQVIKYLAATDYSIALLVNFGGSSLEHERILPPKKIQEHKKKQQNEQQI